MKKFIISEDEKIHIRSLYLNEDEKLYEGWFKDRIEDIKFDPKFYIGMGGIILYGILGGVQIYQKNSMMVNNKKYYNEVLKPILQKTTQENLHSLSKQVGEENIEEYIEDHPDEFGIGKENSKIYYIKENE